MGPHVRARLRTGGLARLVVPMLLAATFVLPLSTTTAAHAAFLGKRGVIFVSGRLTPKGETDILSSAFRNGTAVLVQDYTPHDHRVNVSPTVSPEGGPHIMFVEKASPSAPGDLYVMDRYPPGGGLPTPIRLTNTPDDEEQPAGSPSGGKIAYVRYVVGQPQIWTMSLSGKNQGPLTCCNVKGTRGRGSVVVGTQPAWSPNSEWIAYVSTDTVPEIAVASVTGKMPLDSTVASFRVTTAGGTSPNWSPLGDRIAFITPQGQLATVDFDPAGLPRTPTILDTPPAGHRDANPAWSPDAFTFHGHSHGLIVFDRGSTVWWIDPNATAPAAHRMKLKGFVAGANPDWQPRCSNEKPSGAAGKKITGTQGPDLLCGGKGNDTIYGLGGDDRIFAGQGSDKVYAGPGNDFVLGGQGGGSNYLDGGPGNDHIEGGTGPDTIVDEGTGSGNDVIEAEDGNDVIRADDGVLGNDRVDGGFGTNTCYVDNPEGGGPPALDFVWNCENTVVSRPAVLPGP